MPDPGGPPTRATALFMGSPEFAVPSLLALSEYSRLQILGVVTQADRPRGRGMKSQPTPVKAAAMKLGYPVLQPLSLKTEVFMPVLQQFAPLDLILVVAYGKKLPDYLLNFPRLGCINLHPSLLPRYRGGAPIQRAIFNGEQVTGVTTMYMDQGWDTGDIIFQEEVPIAPDSTYGELSQILSHVGAKLLVQTVDAVLAGKAPRTKQDESRATHEPLLTPAEEWIDWSQPALKICLKVRGLSPEPGAKSRFRDNILRLLRVSPQGDLTPGFSPGTVVEASRASGIIVAAGQGSVRLEVVQPAGKRPMSTLDFLNGYKVQAGETLC